MDTTSAQVRNITRFLALFSGLIWHVAVVAETNLQGMLCTCNHKAEKLSSLAVSIAIGTVSSQKT